MYVTWQLIISVCAGFSAICLSAGYLIKIYKGLKKPGEDMKSSINVRADISIEEMADEIMETTSQQNIKFKSVTDLC